MRYLNASEAQCLFCGIDLTKNHFSLHAVEQNGKVILHKSVTRSELLTPIENMPIMGVAPITRESGRYQGKRVNQSDLYPNFSCR